MIQCNSCGFSVSDSMKFALMQNSCPSCGSNLFSNKDTNLISMIQGQLSSQRFASTLGQDMMYDISLFIFDQLKHGLGKTLADEAVLTSKQGAGPKVEEKTEGKAEEQTHEEIRSEMEAEFFNDEVEEDEGVVLGEDGIVFTESTSERAEQLKRLRRQQLNGNRNNGEPVNRFSPKRFKGVRRAE